MHDRHHCSTKARYIVYTVPSSEQRGNIYYIFYIALLIQAIAKSDFLPGCTNFVCIWTYTIVKSIYRLTTSSFHLNSIQTVLKTNKVTDELKNETTVRYELN